MRFKTERVRAEWFGADLHGVNIDPRMKEVATSAIYFAESIGWDPLLTCILRTPLENDLLYGGHGYHRNGVHVVGRGVDIRTLGEDQGRVTAVIEHVNEEWIYDPARPAFKCALYEGGAVEAGSSAAHLHLQVFPATVERSFGGPSPG